MTRTLAPSAEQWAGEQAEEDPAAGRGPHKSGSGGGRARFGSKRPGRSRMPRQPGLRRGCVRSELFARPAPADHADWQRAGLVTDADPDRRSQRDRRMCPFGSAADSFRAARRFQSAAGPSRVGLRPGSRLPPSGRSASGGDTRRWPRWTRSAAVLFRVRSDDETPAVLRPFFSAARCQSGPDRRPPPGGRQPPRCPDRLDVPLRRAAISRGGTA